MKCNSFQTAIALISAMLVLFSCQRNTQKAADGQGADEMKLVWSDEFDRTGHPDPEKWRYEEGFVRHREVQYYTKNRLENARVENGNLIITARKEIPDNLIRRRGENDDVFRFYTSNSGGEYTSASLNTEDLFECTYGRIEIRAKMPQGRGVWPAIWMLGNNLAWEGDRRIYSEIDIMEFVGYDPTRIHANIHPGFRGGDKGGSIDVEGVSENFHTYAVEWYPDHLDFFYDDTKYFSYYKKDYTAELWPYDTPHYLLINLAVGGEWGGKEGIDESIFPQEYLIDYVRVYELDIQEN